MKAIVSNSTVFFVCVYFVVMNRDVRFVSFGEFLDFFRWALQ